jgi:exodeoxyribonuclease III
MRVISFCSQGIVSAAERGFFDWVIKQDADIICIQDLRAEEKDLHDDVFFPEGYFPYFFDSPGGNNGVAIYCRQMPKAIMRGLGFIEFDDQALYIQADYEEISIGSLMIPGSTSTDVDSLEKKFSFLDKYMVHLEKIAKKRKHLLIAGNWNIAHKTHDVDDAEKMNNTPGFMLEERRWMDRVLGELSYCDAFREINKDDDEFTYISGDKRMRLDYQIVSNSFKPQINHGAVYKVKQFGEHAPLIMDYDYEF